MVQAKGIDVSHHNGVVDWKAVAAAGVSFCFLKSNQGRSFVDWTFKDNAARAKAAGIFVGAYHFFDPGYGAEEQAQNFLNTISGVRLDLPPVLDWEMDGGDQSQVDVAQSWLNSVEAETKKTPIIYSFTSFLENIGLPSSFARYPSWVASYEPEPHIVAPWTDYKFWQTSASGVLHGVNKHFDVDLFNGTVDDLKKFAAA